MLNTNSEYISLDDTAAKKAEKKIRMLTILSIFLGIVSITFIVLTAILYSNAHTTAVTIPIESIIVPTVDIAVNHIITEDSAAAVNRTGDFKKSPYYKVVNFYNGNATQSLQILPKFQTYQQTSVYSCGAAAGFMALRYLGINDVSENDIAIAAETKPHTGTSAVNLAKALDTLTNDTYSVTFSEVDGNMEWGAYIKMIKGNIQNNAVMMIDDIDWGGHWRVIIGYDDMGTKTPADDVIVLADPFDTTDHNQDGYVVQSAERAFSTWTTSHRFDGPHEQLYVTIQKKNE